MGTNYFKNHKNMDTPQYVLMYLQITHSTNHRAVEVIHYVYADVALDDSDK